VPFMVSLDCSSVVGLAEVLGQPGAADGRKSRTEG